MLREFIREDGRRSIFEKFCGNIEKVQGIEKVVNLHYAPNHREDADSKVKAYNLKGVTVIIYEDFFYCKSSFNEYNTFIYFAGRTSDLNNVNEIIIDTLKKCGIAKPKIIKHTKKYKKEQEEYEIAWSGQEEIGSFIY